ncbi:MAG: DUF433 domain-containing protein [Clostridiales Family XIII bacterium]|jgi:uncharacterized protein (DUF433 family)|nr:DUF433 domain-containing protein [Clostridiales Family XIII bacterium]
MDKFERISLKPDVMGGKACIKGTRVTVSMIVSHLAEGISADEILKSFPYITREDIAEALRYAARLSDVRELDFECA